MDKNIAVHDNLTICTLHENLNQRLTVYRSLRLLLNGITFPIIITRSLHVTCDKLTLILSSCSLAINRTPISITRITSLIGINEVINQIELIVQTPRSLLTELPCTSLPLTSLQILIHIVDTKPLANIYTIFIVPVKLESSTVLVHDSLLGRIPNVNFFINVSRSSSLLTTLLIGRILCPYQTFKPNLGGLNQSIV